MTSAERFPRSTQVLAWFFIVQGVLLISCALWFRVRSLGNAPGLNGDEAWYGAWVLDLLNSGKIPWRTPTGNLANPFFLLPLAAIHAVFEPSIILLRSVAVASGLVTLVVNFFLCRPVFGRLTAIISTAALAVLPVSIAYSRFAWDACQTPLAVLLVFYFALGAVKFPEVRRRFLVLAILAEGAAFLVHPTNVFATAVILSAVSARWTPEELKQVVLRCFSDRRILAGLLLGALVVGAAGWKWSQTTGPATAAERLVGGRDLAQKGGLASFVVLYPRLLLGPTTVEYITGSTMWCEWPSPTAGTRLGLDVVLFWIALAAAVGALWRSWRTAQRWEDRTLLSAWGLALSAFLLVAGPAAMIPHYERYALVLVVPTVLVLARGLTLACENFPSLGLAMLLAASSAGWLLLGDFDAHYFRYLAETGGRSHLTFRTAATEPKQAAVEAILARRSEADSCIATSEYWLYWPLRYLAGRADHVKIIRSKDVPSAGCWQVEFVGSKAQRRLQEAGGREELLILDAAAEPLIDVFAPAPAKPNPPE